MPGVQHGDSVALSPLQSLFWVDTLLNPEVPLNDVLLRIDFQGPVDEPRFARAFARLVGCSEALRARIDRDATTLRFGAPEPRLDIVHAQDPNEAAGEMHGLVARPFGPGEPLHRALLVRTGEDRWTFLLDQHHAVADGASCALLCARLSALYADEALDPTPDGDRFRAHMAKPHDPEARRYWNQVFPRPVPERSFYGLRHEGSDALTIRARVGLSPELSARLTDRGPTRTLTLATFAWMRRVTAEDDLCLGVPLANRGPADGEATGLFMEVCPNRLEVPESASFAALDERLAEHLEASRPYRGATVAPRTAGYDVLLDHHPDTPTTFLGRPCWYELTTPLNLIAELGPGWPQERSVGRSEALSIHAHRRAGTYELVFDFNGSLWADVALRERVPVHFSRMLEHLLRGRDEPIGALDILAPDERKHLFGAVASVAKPEAQPSDVVEAVLARAAAHPERPAVVYEDRTVDYAALAAQIDRVAAHLQASGVGPGARVALCVERSEALPGLLLGVLRAGAAYVPLAPNHPPARNRLVVEDARPAVVVGDGEPARALAEATETPYLELERLSSPAPPPTAIVRPELAYVIYTSGSTGRPKGVRVRRRGLAAFLAAMAQTPGFTANDRILAVTTVTFDIAGLELFLPLTVGGSVEVAPYETTIDGEALARRVDQGACTVLQATPATFRMMIAAGWPARPRGLRVLCGGEAMPPDLARGLLERADEVWNMYGPTETTVWSTVKRIARPDRVDVGQPIPGTRIYVANSEMQAVPIGVPGELLIGGEGLAEGYHDRPELTAERFRPNPFAPSELIYRTGDRVRLSEHLDVEYLGRMDFQVKIRGFRVELPEIEAHLETHPDVAQAVVLATQDASGETALTAFVRGAGENPEPGALSAYLRERVPPYMVPPTFVRVDGFPLNTNGKVDRKALAKMDRPPEPMGMPASAKPPQSQLQASLLGAWRMVLGRQDFGVDDDFFRIGGHSIMALELVRAMEQATGLGISLGMVFERPTIEQLDEALADRAASSPSIVVPLNDHTGEAPVFFVLGIDVYRPLARTLPAGHPAFGIYVDDERTVLEHATSPDEAASIPLATLAEAYLEAVVRQSPGPYRLAGLSFGGLVAYEVALRLEARGDTVEWVVLLDTVLPSAVERTWLGLVRAGARRLRDRTPTELLHEARILLAKAILPPGIELEAGEDDAARALGHDARASRIAKARDRVYDEAAARYRSDRKLNGRLVLVRAEDHSEMGAAVRLAPDFGWGGFVTGRLETVDSPGGHISMLQAPHVTTLGARLWPRLGIPGDR